VPCDAPCLVVFSHNRPLAWARRESGEDAGSRLGARYSVFADCIRGSTPVGMRNKHTKNKRHISEHGQDPLKISNWQWSGRGRDPS